MLDTSFSLNSLFHLTFLFWLILDSVGNIPLFVSLLKHFDPPKQRKIILRELTIALVVLFLAFFFGKNFFKLLNISEQSLQISGGIILFLISLDMIFAEPKQEKKESTKSFPKDPLIVPLAIPSIAGPAILTTIILYAGSEGSKGTVFLAIFLAWLLSLPALLFSPLIKKFFGDNGIVAVERLFGFIVALISIDMIYRGIASFIKGPFLT